MQTANETNNIENNSSMAEIVACRLAAAVAGSNPNIGMAAGSLFEDKHSTGNIISTSSTSSFADVGKFLETRNVSNIFCRFKKFFKHSTESTASTSTISGTQIALGESGGSIPRKQDIQTDIRMNKGRFQLVRKRGRSEVWNLFGQVNFFNMLNNLQVVDTLTGTRLPYVACYACKVLYTDTGGGTGELIQFF